MSRRQTLQFERHLAEDHRRHTKQAKALLSQRAEVRRLSDIINREHKVSALTSKFFFVILLIVSLSFYSSRVTFLT